MLLPFKGKDGREFWGEVIRSEPRLKALANKLKRVQEFAFDTETTSLRAQWKGELGLVGISICFGSRDTYYIPVGHYFDEKQLDLDLVLKYLRPIFKRKDVRVIGHNLKYDMHVMADFDCPVMTHDLFDTMIASWIIDENEPKGLKHLTTLMYEVEQEHYDHCLTTVTKEEKKEYGLKGSQKPPFLLVRVKNGAPYAMADAYWTWRHYVDWQAEGISMEKMESIYTKVMIPFLRTLYSMERRGAKIDKARLEQMRIKAEKDLADLEYQIYEIAGVKFNPASGQQLGEILFGYKKFNKKGEFTGNKDILAMSFDFPVLAYTDGGAPATGDGALKALAKMTYKKDKRKKEGVKMIGLILKYKRLAKLKSAFIEGLLNQVYEDGKVHPTFNLGGASSGRLSCSEPKVNWAVA